MTGSPTSNGLCEARLESRVNASDTRLSERDVTLDRGVEPTLTAELGLYTLLCLLGGVTGTACSPYRELVADDDEGGRPMLGRGPADEKLVLEKLSLCLGAPKPGLLNTPVASGDVGTLALPAAGF